MLPVENETDLDKKNKNVNEAESSCSSSTQKRIVKDEDAQCSDGIRVRVVAEINKSLDVITAINGNDNSLKRQPTRSENSSSKRPRLSEDVMNNSLAQANQVSETSAIESTSNFPIENINTACNTSHHNKEVNNLVLNLKSEPLVESQKESNTNDVSLSSSGTSDTVDVKPAIKVEKADASSTSRDSCRFGIRCYRLNPMHRKEEAHPGDHDYRRPIYPPPPEGTADCPYGDLCYRRNPVHFEQFNHPPETDFEQNYQNYRLRLRQHRQQERIVDDANNTSNNSSEIDEDYDLDDPFINDEELDSDYVPNSNEEDDEDDYDACDKAEE